MPGGLADQVIAPTAASSPGWVQHLVNFGVNVWDYHPVQAAASAVWIQLGIGVWLLIAVRGWSARLAGLAAVAWGLVVWVFGEAFGGIFAPGLTALFGAPGAALIYVVAGALIALPERAWDRPERLGRLLLGGTGAFFLGMALLQAWPGRGFWQGRAAGQLGSLAAMIKSMAATSQPHPLAVIVSWFGNFTAGARVRGQPGRGHRARRPRRRPVRRRCPRGRAARQDRGRRRRRVLPSRLAAR